MLNLKFQYFDHLMQRTDSFGKTLMLGKTEGRRRSGHGIIDTMDTSLSKLRKLVTDREAWHAAIRAITKIWTKLSD